MRLDAAISLIPVALDNLGEVETIFDDLGSYSRLVDGLPRRDGAAREFATALPPGHERRHKHAFLARRGGLSVGVLDILDGRPAPGTAFIGLLAVRESAQGSGVGRALFDEAERFARYHLKARILRLAVVEANPVIGYWSKMGFLPTGEVRIHHGQAITSRAVLMEKAI